MWSSLRRNVRIALEVAGEWWYSSPASPQEWLFHFDRIEILVTQTTCLLCPQKNIPYCCVYMGRLLRLDQSSLLSVYWAICLFSSYIFEQIYRSVQSSLHRSAYYIVLSIFGWMVCLDVLQGLKNTGMLCLLKILLSFLDTPSMSAMTVLMNLLKLEFLYLLAIFRKAYTV